MAKNSKTGIKIGGGVWSVLLIIFVLAKIFAIGEIATWSWVWVLSPLWLPFAVFAGIFTLIVFILIILGLIYNS